MLLPLAWSPLYSSSFWSSSWALSKTLSPLALASLAVFEVTLFFFFAGSSTSAGRLQPVS